MAGPDGGRHGAAYIGLSNYARAERLIVAAGTLHPLVPFLGLDGQCGDGPGFEAGQVYGLVGFFTISVGAVLDPFERIVDLGNELPCPVPCPQFQGPVGFQGCAISDIGFLKPVFLKMLKGLGSFAKKLVSPAEQFPAKIFFLFGIHKRLFFRWPIITRYFRWHIPALLHRERKRRGVYSIGVVFRKQGNKKNFRPLGDDICHRLPIGGPIGAFSRKQLSSLAIFKLIGSIFEIGFGSPDLEEERGQGLLDNTFETLNRGGLRSPEEWNEYGANA